MDERIRGAFEGVRAPEELKARTAAFLAGERERRERARRPGLRRWAPALACLVLVLAGLTGWGVYFSPAAAISLDVNPSVELTLNRFDRVIGVTCYGVETEEAEGWQSLRFLDYRDAVDSLLGSGSIADCLAREEPLSISVASGDGAAQAEILENVRACAGGMGNVHCYAADAGQVEQAHHAGVSFGKYQAFLYLQELDPTVGEEEVQEMTMAEIRQRIAQLTGAESAPPGSGQGNGQDSGQSGGAQSGQGHGHGWDHGGHE